MSSAISTSTGPLIVHVDLAKEMLLVMQNLLAETEAMAQKRFGEVEKRIEAIETKSAHEVSSCFSLLFQNNREGQTTKTQRSPYLLPVVKETDQAPSAAKQQLLALVEKLEVSSSLALQQMSPTPQASQQVSPTPQENPPEKTVAFPSLTSELVPPLPEEDTPQKAENIGTVDFDPASDVSCSRQDASTATPVLEPEEVRLPQYEARLSQPRSLRSDSSGRSSGQRGAVSVAHFQNIEIEVPEALRHLSDDLTFLRKN